MPLIQALADIFNAVLAPILDVIAGLFNGISQAISAVIGWISDAIGAVGDFFGGVGSFFSGLFGGGEADVNVNADQVPQFAEGGIVNKPTLAIVGEGGEPEAIIPFSKINEIFNNPERAMAEAAPQGDWIGDTLNTLSADGNSETFTDNSQPITITYSPQYTFGGTPDKEEMVEAEKMSQEEFRRMMNQWMKENSRTSLKGAFV